MSICAATAGEHVDVALVVRYTVCFGQLVILVSTLPLSRSVTLPTIVIPRSVLSLLSYDIIPESHCDQ